MQAGSAAVQHVSSKSARFWAIKVLSVAVCAELQRVVAVGGLSESEQHNACHRTARDKRRFG
jgi:hypothetical protein